MRTAVLATARAVFDVNRWEDDVNRPLGMGSTKLVSVSRVVLLHAYKQRVHVAELSRHKIRLHLW